MSSLWWILIYLWFFLLFSCREMLTVPWIGSGRRRKSKCVNNRWFAVLVHLYIKVFKDGDTLSKLFLSCSSSSFFWQFKLIYLNANSTTAETVQALMGYEKVNEIWWTLIFLENFYQSEVLYGKGRYGSFTGFDRWKM